MIAGLPETAREIAASLRRREVSAVEVTDHFLEVIAAREGDVGAFVELRPERARRAARAADRRLAARGQAAPPLLGVPTAIKDHEHLRGYGTRVGSRALWWVWSPMDGAVASACRRAGCVFFGKTATSELTILPFVHTETHLPVRNPFDRERYAGGSSGGSAAAVGAGMLPIAPGSDGGGSIRIPASFCGLVGFKPGRGTLPNPYRAFDRAEISAQGPLARDVRDAALLLEVLARRAPGDRDHDYLAACERDTPPLSVGIWRQSPLAATEPAVAAVVDAAARALASLGHRVEEGAPLEGTVDEFIPLMAKLVAGVPLLSERQLQPTTRWLRSAGRALSAADVARRRQDLEDRILAWSRAYDVWLTPTVPTLPPRVGAFSDLDGEAMFRAAAPIGAFTAPFNVAGMPALSLPAGRHDGVPIGVQLVAQRGGEATLLSLAARLEAQLASS